MRATQLGRTLTLVTSAGTSDRTHPIVQAADDGRGEPALACQVLVDREIVPEVLLAQEDQDLVVKGDVVCAAEWNAFDGADGPEIAEVPQRRECTRCWSQKHSQSRLEKVDMK